MPINLLLKCLDVEATKSFYEQTLNFEVIGSHQSSYTVRKGDCRVIFTEDDLWTGDPKCTGTFYMFIDDVDAYYESIKEKVSILWPLQDMSYGTREFGIKDCDGYHLAFAHKTE